MDFEFKLPDIGEGITEGEVVAWHVSEGDAVKEDDALVDVMTDKATVTISSPKTGTVSKRMFAEGDMAPVGEVLVVIALEGGEPAKKAPAKSEPEKSEPEAAEPEKSEPEEAEPEKSEPQPREEPPARPQRREEPQPRARAAEEDAGRPEKRLHALATPATRKLARELGVDIQAVPGTGKGGRVTREDVQAYATRQEAPTEPAREPAQAPTGGERRVPLRGLRRRIHAKMSEAKHTAAHFHYVDEIDMTALVALRERTKDRAATRGVRMTYLPFIIKATIAALREHPYVNASMDDEASEIVLHDYYDIGIATATEAGLVVTVVHGADRKGLYEIAKEIEELAEKARKGTLERKDVTGSTFTITSLGKLGGMFATPIVNYPELAILGIHKIEPRPVVVDGQIVVRDRMYMSSSFDHRIIDGHVGAAFVQRIKELLEDPDALVMEAL